MSEIVLRDAGDGELDTIAEVMVAAYDEYIPPNPTGEWLAYREEIRDVRRRLGYTRLIVAEEGGRILGAVTYYADAGKDEHAGWPPGGAAIRPLGVHPAARGPRGRPSPTGDCS